ncbi:AAA family ATPase [Natronorubrum halophilum]|uniref:AAA family ATPase n=1 Tax=Natronorubrum halophilum TaxID=1702106 RepID=UPI000EF71FDE|nr:AAA family ATPase [Natronorubrum halophilum]
MKIEELQINNFRGITELEKQPKGDNIGLIGPNGSGKSSVMDAIDFLLTGTVQRMTGEGTGDISIEDHGPHVDSDPEDSWVEITFSNDSEKITLKRTVEDNSLEYDGELPDSLELLIDAAERGQHLLSRSEILNFIVARKQSRSEQLRTLLKLSNIKQKRLELQGAADQLGTEADRKEREYSSSQQRLFSLFEEEAQSLEEVQQKVNQIREDLDGEPLDELDPDTEFRNELESPTDRASASPIQSKQTKELLTKIEEWFENDVEEFLELEAELREKTEAVRSDEEALRALDVLELIQDGRQFLDEDADCCPLCLTDWDAEELEELLEEREEKAAEANKKMEELNGIQQELLPLLTEIRTAVDSLTNILGQHDDFDTENLEDLFTDLEEYEENLEDNIVDELPYEEYEREERKQVLKPENAVEYISELKSRAEDLPDLDALQNAWDVLNSAYENYQDVIRLETVSEEYREAADQMDEVQKEFINSRDSVLNETYEAISEQFEKYYKTIHGEEEDFSPDISPTETGLDIQVGFHGRGKHPPHALHSEGHQDSMGLCLYLALCDYLEGGDLPLIMLDDVVMSVDAEHRRPLANLLEKEISSDFQILMTTHDELWYRHLKTVGVLSRRSTIKFSSWSLDDGPQIIGKSGDEWDRVEELMDEGDVQAAASRLRHTAEWFLRETCHQLGARVQFKSDSRWTLGDFSGPAMSRFKELLKQAKRAGSSWGNDISDINDLDDKRSQVYTQFNNEMGAVNPNVHFNEDEWATFTIAELQPAVDAFKELYDLFWCSNCNSCLSVVEEGYEEVALKCSCGGKAHWTLEEN